MKKILIATILILGLCVSSASVMAEPVVDDSAIAPEEPERLDTITITATITSDETIDEVNMIIKECVGGTDNDYCHLEDTQQMTLSGDNEYTCTYELQWPEVTYISYWFEITSNGELYKSDYTNVSLKVDSDNGDANGGGDGGNGSPGFELIPLLIAVFIGVILLKRKRSG